uniref:Uncharacterized protein n=1 Tax=Timema poppense TaxID=170557 RepID=A0A7R9HBV4_TIMPO|nr:unnamed protein product [Timema poppensis]
MTALAEAVRCSWSYKEPEDFTYYDLTYLQHILCGFNRTEIERIHPKAYKEAAYELGQLKNCPIEVLEGLATLATQAFGTTSSWTDTQIKLIGCVLAGLDSQINLISARAMEGLTSETSHCISQYSVKPKHEAHKSMVSSGVVEDTQATNQQSILDEDKEPSTRIG